jgi:hypothetical protein
MLVMFRMFESIYTAPNGRVPMPKTLDADMGLHCVALTGGWDDVGESLQFVNSWGTRWGDRGHGWLSRKYLDAYMHDPWLRRRTRWGPPLSNVLRLEARTQTAPTPPHGCSTTIDGEC